MEIPVKPSDDYNTFQITITSFFATTLFERLLVRTCQERGLDPLELSAYYGRCERVCGALVLGTEYKELLKGGLGGAMQASPACFFRQILVAAIAIAWHKEAARGRWAHMEVRHCSIVLCSPLSLFPSWAMVTFGACPHVFCVIY